MSSPTVEVVAPSRLHFGMFSFGQSGTRQFGGVGAMVRQPGVRLRLAPADRFEAHGPLSRRVGLVVERISRLLEPGGLPACRIEIVEAAPEHVGLGTGTQLALAVAAAIDAFRAGESLPPSEWAAWSGRAERSAIGTYGFMHGGLLVEAGKLPGELLSPLEERVALPSGWRFVLIWPKDQHGLSGDAERLAFRDLPAVSPAATAGLRREVRSELLPAARAGDFERFGDSLYRFAARQGGAFASPRIGQLVRTIRELGVRGVGQSSWGPTVFALLENSEAATRFTDRIREHVGSEDTVLVAEPSNTGARITRHPQV